MSTRKIYLSQINASSALAGYYVVYDGTTWASSPLPAALSGLAGLDATSGIIEQTGDGTFTKRLVGTSTGDSLLSRDAGDGRYSLSNHVHDFDDVTGLQAALDGKEPSLGSGTTSQYLRGDKSFQTLDKTAVGLDQVDNTSDANKPISTATQSALDGKEDFIVEPESFPRSYYLTGDKTWRWLNKASVYLDQVDNTSDLDKPVSTAQQAALDLKEDLISAGTTSQYWRGDKTWADLTKNAVGLGNVDNTSDANKPVSTAQQAALDARITRQGTGDVIANGSDELIIQSGVVSASHYATAVKVSRDAFFDDVSYWGVVDNDGTNTTDFTIGSTADVSASTGSWLGYPHALRSPSGNGTTSQTLGSFASRTVEVSGGDKIRLRFLWKVVAGFTGQGKLTIAFTDVDGAPISSTADEIFADYRSSAAGADAAGSIDLDYDIPATAHRAQIQGTCVWSSSLSNAGEFFIQRLSAEQVPSVQTHSHVISDIGGLQTALDGKQDDLGSGTTSQYLRGDLTFQLLDKTAVGLGNVNNTADVDKPVSTAQQAALDGKADASHAHDIADVTGLQTALDGKLAASAVSAFGLTLIDDVDAIAARATLGLGSASTEDSTAFASSTHGHTVSDVSGLQAALDAKQPLASKLTALAGMDTSLGVVEQTGDNTFAKRALGVGAATSVLTRADGDARFAAITHAHSISDITGLTTSLASKEPSISSGTTAQYWRGDKTWQTLNKSAVGLSNVDNTSDANKPVSTAQQTALNLKANLASPTFTGDVTLAQDPTLNLHAATKQYVDNVAQGLDAKQSVLVATTANITLSGEQTIDGVLTSGSRVLVKNQTNAAQNGIYVTASSAWSRAVDMNSWSEVPGAFTFIEEGSTHANSGWVCTSNKAGTLGSTAITWSQFNGATGYTASNGVSLVGNDFQLATAAANTLKGNATGSPAVPTDLSGSQVVAILPVFSSSTKGVVPSSGGGTTKFLRADGTWIAPTDEKAIWGNITGTLSSQTDLAAALDAKIDDSQISTFGLSLIDDASAADARTTLGLGSAALQATSYFALASHGHAISDVTGLQTALDDKLDAALATVFGLDLLDSADADDARTTLGLGTAATQDSTSFAATAHAHAITDVTGLQAALDAKAALTSPVFTSPTTTNGWYVQSGDGKGLYFQDTSGQFKLYMSTSANGTEGGDLSGTSTNNIYFKTTGTNRGFVFKNGSTALAEITHTGVLRTLADHYVNGNLVYHAGNLLAATTSVTGLLSAADKTKLDGIATGATANSSDATLLARANHTGVQAISTVSGLQTALDDKLDDSQASTLGLDLLSTASASAARTSLGLGTAALRADSYFALASHAHTIADITSLQSTLDNKADLTGATFTGWLTAPRININRSSETNSGVQWWNSSANHWLEYLAVGGDTNQGPNGNLTAPTGTYVTGRALRSIADNTAGMGWTWESNPSATTTPTLIAELSVGGVLRTLSDHYVGSNRVFHQGFTPTKAEVGLGNVDNTSDANKPVSTAQQTALDGKADKGAIGSSGLTMATALLLGRTTASSGAIEGISVGTGLTLSGGSLATNLNAVAYSGSASDLSSGNLPVGRLPAFNGGDVESSIGTKILTIVANAVTLPKLAQVSTATFLGRSTAATGNVEAMTATQATALLDLFTTSTKGLVPATGTPTGKFLKDDGVWTTIPAPSWGAILGTLSDQTDLQSALNAKENSIAAGTTAQYWRGDKTWQTLNKSAVGLGNVTNTSDANKPVSTAQQAALNLKADKGLATASGLTMATDRILGRTSASTGAVEEITVGDGLELSGGVLSTTASGLPSVAATGTGGVSQDVTLPLSGFTVEDVLVTVNGIIEDPDEYSISGTTLTMFAPVGAKIRVRFFR